MRSATEDALFKTGLLASALALIPLIDSFSQDPTFLFDHRVFNYTLFGCMPAALLIEAVIRFTRKGDRVFPIWVRKPTVTHEFTAEAANDQVIHDVISRLRELDYDVEKPHVENEILRIEFEKKKKDRVENFSQHGSFGSITIKHQASGLQIDGSLTFDDILVVETGEYALLKNVLAYVVEGGAEPDLRSSPFVAECGFVAALFSSFYWVFSSVVSPEVSGYVYSAALAGAPLLAYGLVSVALNRKQAYGMKLCLLGLALCGLPFLSLL